MEIKNAVFNGVGGIDCEIDHPAFGWIPFTARDDGPEEFGRMVYEAALAMGPSEYVPPPPPAPVPPTREQQESSRQAAFAAEADPLFFQWQAGEATEAEWKAKRQEIRDRYPYPEA